MGWNPFSRREVGTPEESQSEAPVFESYKESPEQIAEREAARDRVIGERIRSNMAKSPENFALKGDLTEENFMDMGLLPDVYGIGASMRDKEIIAPTKSPEQVAHEVGVVVGHHDVTKSGVGHLAIVVLNGDGKTQ